MKASTKTEARSTSVSYTNAIRVVGWRERVLANLDESDDGHVVGQ
jgi:hypothetical protein